MSAKFTTRTADATCKFDLGARVYDEGDPRHVGKVERINHGSTATVRWEETGWLSDVPQHKLRKAPA